LKKVSIKLHGILGKTIGKANWNLAVKSVSEAIHAINILTNNKLNQYLNKHGYDKFEIVINGRKFKHDKFLDPKDREILNEVANSELNIKSNNLETIDIIPVIDASDSDFFAIILGAILIIVGIALVATGVGGPLGGALIMGGIGIVAAGVINLLSKPPSFEPFQAIESGGKKSYLFSGPENTIREGGAVPVGYGRLLVGSQTISASYDVYNIPITDNIASQIKPGSVLRAYYFGNTVNLADVGYFRSVSTAGTFYEDIPDKISVSSVSSIGTEYGNLLLPDRHNFFESVLPEGAPRNVYLYAFANSSSFTITLFNVYPHKEDGVYQAYKLRMYFWGKHAINQVGGTINYSIAHNGLDGSPATGTITIPTPTNITNQFTLFESQPLMIQGEAGSLSITLSANSITPFLSALSLIWDDGVVDTNTSTMMN
jgi:predicted phage tail protein